MLRVGDTAPPIDAVTSLGTRFVLSEQSGLCTVLYFFPKAFTPHCTREAKLFRDNQVEIELAGATVVGISTDNHETQCRFAASTEAKFPMIADADQTISRAYDVLWPLIGLAHRVTYVVSPKRRVEAVFRHELNPEAHRDDVLRFVNRMYRAARGE
jgi:peroxiredoxin